MPRELREVWACYRDDGSLYGIALRPYGLHPERDEGWRQERLGLLTPEAAAVLAAAEAWADAPEDDDYNERLGLDDAVHALRAYRAAKGEP
jgi:hypothetical protein